MNSLNHFSSLNSRVTLGSELWPDRNLVPGLAPLFSSCVHRFSSGILVSSHSPETGSSGWLETLNCPRYEWMVCAPCNGRMTCTEGTKHKAEWMRLTLSLHFQQTAFQRSVSAGLSGSEKKRFQMFKWSRFCRSEPVLGRLLGPQLTLHLITNAAPAGHVDSQSSHLF